VLRSISGHVERDVRFSTLRGVHRTCKHATSLFKNVRRRGSHGTSKSKWEMVLERNVQKKGAVGSTELMWLKTRMGSGLL
jgi:hypothetical protein